MTEKLIIKELKEKLIYPNYKKLTIDEYNWLCEQMELTRNYLEGLELKEAPKKLNNK